MVVAAAAEQINQLIESRTASRDGGHFRRSAPLRCRGALDYQRG